jgi:hypothetical protein
VARQRIVIALGIVLVVLVVAALTAFALLVDVRMALWGVVGFFTVLLFVRVLGPERTWLKARSKLFDSVFLLAIIVGLALTISFATTPSPI